MVFAIQFIFQTHYITKEFSVDVKKKILIVEDEVLTAIYLQHQLNKNNCEVLQIVSSGEEAIKIASDSKPDVILLDVRLAGMMDGFDVAHKVVQIYSPIIVFMTGYRTNDIKTAVDNIPNAIMFEKPIKVKELLTAITSN